MEAFENETKNGMISKFGLISSTIGQVAELHFFADRCPENGGTQLFQGYEPISSESYEDHPAVMGLSGRL